MNPGIAPSGLFWTTALPENAVKVNLGDGSAVMQATNLSVLHFGDFGNSLFGRGVPPVPATVSFTVRWSGVLDRAKVVSTDTGMTGEFIRNTAQMEWSATVGDFDFVSAPAETSASDFAEIGRERNGTFFTRG